MKLQLDQAISSEINKILTKAKLSGEMDSIINSSLNVECETGELYKWAHLTLINCECVSGLTEVALPGAIAMELAALAIDIFDDIQDQDHDDLPWRQIPMPNALNLAICLSMLSSETILALREDSDPELYKKISQILNRMRMTCSDGQFQEALFDTSERISLDQYFELIEHKSGSLTACACKIGAVLGEASDSLVLQLEQFGIYLGIMSQIRNDLNDFLDFEKKKDFVNHKKTLPYVYLSNILTGDKAEHFKRLTEMTKDKNFGQQEQDALKQLVINEGAIHYCRIMYELFREKSLDILETIPVSKERKEKMFKLVK